MFKFIYERDLYGSISHHRHPYSIYRIVVSVYLSHFDDGDRGVGGVEPGVGVEEFEIVRADTINGVSACLVENLSLSDGGTKEEYCSKYDGLFHGCLSLGICWGGAGGSKENAFLVEALVALDACVLLCDFG